MKHFRLIHEYILPIIVTAIFSVFYLSEQYTTAAYILFGGMATLAFIGWIKKVVTERKLKKDTVDDNPA